MEKNNIPTKQQWDNAIASFWYEGSVRRMQAFEMDELKDVIDALADYCSTMDEKVKDYLEQTIHNAIQQIDQCRVDSPCFIKTSLDNILDFLRKIYKGKDYSVIRINCVPFAINTGHFGRAAALLREGFIDAIYLGENSLDRDFVSCYLRYGHDVQKFKYDDAKLDKNIQKTISEDIDRIPYIKEMRDAYKKVVNLRNPRSHGNKSEAYKGLNANERREKYSNALLFAYKETTKVIPNSSYIDMCTYTAYIETTFAANKTNNNNTHSCDGKGMIKNNMEALTSEKMMTTENKKQFEDNLIIKVCGWFQKCYGEEGNDIVIIETPILMRDEIKTPHMLVKVHNRKAIAAPDFYRGCIIECPESTFIEGWGEIYDLLGYSEVIDTDNLTGSAGYTQYDIKYMLVVLPDEKQEDASQENAQEAGETSDKNKNNVREEIDIEIKNDEENI